LGAFVSKRLSSTGKPHLFKPFLPLLSPSQSRAALADIALNWSNIPVVPIAITLVLGKVDRQGNLQIVIRLAGKQDGNCEPPATCLSVHLSSIWLSASPAGFALPHSQDAHEILVLAVGASSSPESALSAGNAGVAAFDECRSGDQR
jgi:hypothetical protein